jgi:hypothetical protein
MDTMVNLFEIRDKIGIDLFLGGLSKKVQILDQRECAGCEYDDECNCQVVLLGKRVPVVDLSVIVFKLTSFGSVKSEFLEDSFNCFFRVDTRETCQTVCSGVCLLAYCGALRKAKRAFSVLSIGKGSGLFFSRLMDCYLSQEPVLNISHWFINGLATIRFLISYDGRICIGQDPSRCCRDRIGKDSDHVEISKGEWGLPVVTNASYSCEFEYYICMSPKCSHLRQTDLSFVER